MGPMRPNIFSDYAGYVIDDRYRLNLFWPKKCDRAIFDLVPVQLIILIWASRHFARYSPKKSS